MPREDRRIIFSYEETYKALYALCVQKEIKRPPPGAIVSVEVDENNDKTIRFKIDNMQDNSSNTLDFSRDFLAAALLLFCRSQSIPVSKRASKSVEFKNDTVILRLVI